MLTLHCVIVFILVGCSWPCCDPLAISPDSSQSSMDPSSGFTSRVTEVTTEMRSVNVSKMADSVTERQRAGASSGTPPVPDKPCAKTASSDNCSSARREVPDGLVEPTAISIVSEQMSSDSFQDENEDNNSEKHRSMGTNAASMTTEWFLPKTAVRASLSSQWSLLTSKLLEMDAAAAAATTKQQQQQQQQQQHKGTSPTVRTTFRSETPAVGGKRKAKGSKPQRPKAAGEASGTRTKQLSGKQMEYLARHFTGFVQNVWLANPTPRAPGPIDDGPFGSILWQDKKYLLSVLIPIAVGFAGAMLIIVMAYVSRAYRKRKDRTIITGAPRSFLEAATSKADDMAPLQESSDDEF
ncbi:uncharacterized protein LOC112571018 isoform X2 [Pomacea canaliculata]|nr:uncharacterized protein LOC112571018 isoform X2 [Pomacea canaliculata]